mmetsp:Transcript_13794/g.28490  ORF Transcript_13794/g.28490 Transcript_13794/m.28490 type:complete len:132 (+) Transcript_13794:2196-2591(+)
MPSRKFVVESPITRLVGWCRSFAWRSSTDVARRARRNGLPLCHRSMEINNAGSFIDLPFAYIFYKPSIKTPTKEHFGRNHQRQATQPTDNVEKEQGSQLYCYQNQDKLFYTFPREPLEKKARSTLFPALQH